MRLIDADALIERTYEAERNIGYVGPTGKWVMEKIREAVESEPTAYDVEKVVAELDKQSIRVGIRGIDGNHDILSLIPTIDIVRNGGKE